MRGNGMITIESVPRELPRTNKQVALREKMTMRDLDFYYVVALCGCHSASSEIRSK
jgi:hypothetical protein